MYKWRNDAKIKEADISWQSIAINIKNILNNNYRAKKFINLNIIDQDEASILKKRQLAKLNNIDHKLSEAEINLFAQSQNELINTLEKFQKAKTQVETLKSALELGCPLIHRERNLQKIIQHQAYLKDIKNTLNPVVKTRLNEILKKNLNDDYLPQDIVLTEEVNGLFCSKLFNFIAYDSEYIDSLSILKDYRVVESDKLYIIPKILIPILDSIKYWLKWFPSCFSWYTDNILKNCTLDWEILATEERFNSSITPVEYLANFEIYINKLNQKLEQLEKIYSKLWICFDYFRRLVIEKYIEYIKDKKRKAVAAYIEKINQHNFLTSNNSAKQSLAILQKAIKIKREFNLGKRTINRIVKSTNNIVLEVFISSILNCGKESFNNQFSNKKLAQYLIKQKQATITTSKIYEIYIFIASLKDLTDERLNHSCQYIAVSYLSNNTQEEQAKLQYHLYNAIKTKKDAEFLDYKNDAIEQSLLQNISMPYWEQIILDNSPVFDEKQAFIYNNWINKTAHTAITEIQDKLFSAKSLLKLIINCKQERLDLYIQASEIFTNNFQILLAQSIKIENIAPELGESLIILKNQMSQTKIQNLQNLIKNNFREKILNSPWSVATSKILINLTPKLSKKYFLEGLYQSMTRDNIGEIFYNHIRYDTSIFRVLGIKHENRQLFTTLLERILANHLQNGHYINVKFIKKLISIENFSRTYIIKEQKNNINLLLKLESCIEKIETLSMSDWKNWRSTLTKAHDLAQLIRSKSDHAYNLFIQKVFLTCSIKWKEWLILNNFKDSVLKARLLEEEILSTSNNLFEYPLFEHLFDPWKVICKYSPYISTAGLNILIAFRCLNVNHLRGIEHKFYIAILQLGLYSEQICNDIKSHCMWLLSKEHKNTKYRKNIYELQSLLNDTNPYYLKSTENIFYIILTAEIPPKINNIPLIDCYPSTFEAEKVFFDKKINSDSDEKTYHLH